MFIEITFFIGLAFPYSQTKSAIFLIVTYSPDKIYPSPFLPLVQVLITPLATSLTSTKSYPPSVNKGTFSFKIFFIKTVILVLVKSFTPNKPDGKTTQAFKLLFLTSLNTYLVVSALVFAYKPTILSGSKLAFSSITS